MAWRTIYISTPAYVSQGKNSLVIKSDQTDGEPVRIAISEVGCVIFETQRATITSSAINLLANNGVTTLFCDQKHHPSAYLLSHEPHSRQLSVLKQQINISQPFKKRLWQKIIKQKIANQAQVLSMLNHSKDNTLVIVKMVDHVKSGDVENTEAKASRKYFKTLLYNGYRNNQKLWFNSAVNYGYAIIRGAISRELAGAGLTTAMGIFHKNELNNFNLSDDLIEPFRPIVDYQAVQLNPHRYFESGELSLEDRLSMVDILNKRVIVAKEKHTVRNAIRIVVQSFKGAIMEKNMDNLLLPTFDYESTNYENTNNV